MISSSTIPRFSRKLDERVAAHLVMLLQHPDNFWTFRDTVLDLRDLGQPATEMLLQVLQDPASAWQAPALRVLERLREPQAVAPLISIMQSAADLELRKKAIHALGLIGVTTAIEPLAAVLVTAEDDSLRETIVDALGEIGDLAAVPPLLQALEDVAPKVRTAAVSGLGRLAGEDPRVLAALLNTRHDIDAGVRGMCIHWIAHIKADAVVPALIAALSDVDEYVRSQAVYGLAGAGDARALPTLEWIREHDTALLEDGSIAESAAYAVECIRKRLS